VDHAQPIPQSFPWRAATFVVAGIAAAELIALVCIGAVHLAPKRAHIAAAPAPAHVAAPKPKARAVPSHPLRARSSVRVLVLNGNGVQGAAGTEASRLRVDGYRIGATRNAARHDYAHSMVLYAPGWLKEARRLARDTGFRVVAPVDGLRPSALKGSKLVVILGSA
jgi:LytR cell envelope-related transcriptional attenuator